MHGRLNVNFMKICPVGAELLHAGGQTDMTKVNCSFSQFCGCP
jgi:hypothetical protein